MAHLTTQRTTKGETRYVVRYRAPDGKERQRWFARRRDAERYRRTVEADLIRGVWIDPRSASVTFRAWASAWLAEPGKRPSAYARDETIVRVHLTPTFGDQPLGSITPADVRRLVVEWSGKYAPRTTKRHYGTLRAIMASAVATDMIGRSPCRGVRLPAAGDHASHVVDGGELQRLASALGPSYGPTAYLGAVLGLRWGEVAGMRVGAVQWLRGTLTVAEQITRGPRGIHVSGPPKSRAGRRTLTIPEPLLDMLRELLEQRALTADGRERLAVRGASRWSARLLALAPARLGARDARCGSRRAHLPRPSAGERDRARARRRRSQDRPDAPRSL